MKPCPCGKTPNELHVTDAAQGGKWAFASGDCCGEWNIEFRTEYNIIGGEACAELAIIAWNDTPRASDRQKAEPNPNILPITFPKE